LVDPKGEDVTGLDTPEANRTVFMPDDVEVDLSRDKFQRQPTVHRWWARRGDRASALAVLLTHLPELATDGERLRAAANDPTVVLGEGQLRGVSLLDLCAGSCTIAATASRMGASVTAVDIHPISALIGKATLVYPRRYGRPEPSSRGIGVHASWAGLGPEVAHWAHELLKRAEAGAGDFWLDNIDGVSTAFRLKCPSCGVCATANPAGDTPDAAAIHRGEFVCPECAEHFRLSEAPREGFEPRRLIRNGKTASLSPQISILLTTARYPDSVAPLLDEPFAFNSLGAISIRQAVTPRQAQVIRACQEALRSVRNNLADAGYAPERAASILTYLALALSALVDLLSTSARWNERRKMPTGLERADWRLTDEFFEVGGSWLRSTLTHRFNEIGAVIEANVDTSPVVVRTEDMTDLEESDASFDLVIWDPPFYDNISYDRVTLPWTRFLRSIIGDIDQSLRWPPDPSIDDRSPAFDRHEYEAVLQRAASEIRRVLKPNGRLGVFWITWAGREVADLAEFLGLLEPNGLELVQPVGLITERGVRRERGESRKPTLLIFRRTEAAQPSDAAAILEGEFAGQTMQVAGLVALLEQCLDEDEISDLIPKDFKGRRSERLAEAVLTAVDPRSFLRRLPKRSLKEFALERGLRREDLEPLDRDAIETLVFRLLGWRSPQEAPFTVGRTLDEIANLCSQLRLTRDERLIRGLATTAFDRVEQVLRFAVVGWAMRLRGDRWDECLQQVVGEARKLTFGHWFRAFSDLPGHYADQDRIIGGANARLRRAKVLPALEAAVTLRNRFAHSDRGGDLMKLRDDAVTILEQVIEALRAAESAGALPRMLQPVSEVRDPYGRITLRLVDHAGRSVEFLMTKPSDLTEPVIVIPSDTNPREVDPARVDASAVLARAGLV
jgi:SAM-dependent methyltransferase